MDTPDKQPDKKPDPIVRTADGKFKKGSSGNPVGRPKGSKNKITLLKQSLELQLRDQAADYMPDILSKAIELGMEGDKTMLKLLLELHMSKGVNDDTKASEKVAIQINAMAPEIKTIKPDEEETNERQADK